MNETKETFYVYRFLINGTIVYVGRTTNLKQRFRMHEHLTKEMDIEYIECTSEAEMIWKEIYYINLYYNEQSLNVADVYFKGTFQAISLDDKWSKYNKRQIASDLSHNIDIDEYNRFMQEVPAFDYKKLIHILNHPKLNEIGRNNYTLCMNWFVSNPELVVKLKNNVLNYFKNIMHGGTETNLWTTYYDCKDLIKGKGYTNGFVRLNGYQAGLYPEKVNLAYMANIYCPAILQKYNLTDDQYALFYLLRFIFQSGLYYGKEINIYIPSRRMRELLITWINEQEYKTN